MGGRATSRRSLAWHVLRVRGCPLPGVPSAVMHYPGEPRDAAFDDLVGGEPPDRLARPHLGVETRLRAALDIPREPSVLVVAHRPSRRALRTP